MPEFEKAAFKINDLHKEFKKSVLFESGFDTIIGSQTHTNRKFEGTFPEQNHIYLMKLNRLKRFITHFDMYKEVECVLKGLRKYYVSV